MDIPRVFCFCRHHRFRRSTAGYAAAILAVLLVSGPARPSELTDKTENGILIFESDDGAFRWWLDGRISAEAAFYYEDKNELSNGTNLRHARLMINSRLWERWRAKLDLSFTGDQAKVEDAWISYNVNNTAVQVGHFKEPISFEMLTSGLHTTFLERAYPFALLPWRSMGLGVTSYGSNWTGAVGIFGENVDSKDTGDDEGFALTGRLTAAPLLRSSELIHLGISASRRTPDADSAAPDELQIHSTAETRVSGATFVNTGTISGVDHWFVYDLEAAFVFGPACLYGEYVITDVQPLDKAVSAPDLLHDARFRGGYAALCWYPTGEVRPYLAEKGTLGRVKPRRSFGAIEIAARLSWIDLDDREAGVSGGQASNVTIGLAWYANQNVRFQINYVFVNNSADADGAGTLLPDDNFSFCQARLQANF
jgi:phosphate-selective porin OprO/OprP